MYDDSEVQSAAGAFRLALPQMPVRGRTGELLGRATGSSLEFQEYREYAPGDDIRHLDWAAYGRSDSLMLRMYREEISPHTEILMDASRSMTTGSGAKEKLTRQVSALLAMLCGRIGGQAVIHVLDDADVPLRLKVSELAEVARLDFRGTSSLIELLEQRRLRLGKRAVRIVISDFLFPHNPESLLKQLAVDAGALWIIQILNRWESDPTPLGGRKLLDVETGTESNIVLDRTAVERYKARLVFLQEELARNCRRMHGHFLTLIAEQGLPALCRDELCAAGLLNPV